MALLALLALTAFGQRDAISEFRLRHSSFARLHDIVSADPKNADAQYYLGLKLAAAQRWLEAATAFHAAFTTDQSRLDAAAELGDSLLRMGLYPEAYQWLRMVTGREPNNARAHMVLGDLYRSRGSYGKAIDEYTEVTKLQPKNADAWHGMGTSYAETQQLQHAEDAIRRAIGIRGSDPAYRIDMARVLMATGKLDEAERQVRQALQVDPVNPSGHFVLGQVCARMPPDKARTQEAESEFRLTLRVAPGYSLAHYELGLLLMARREFADAALHLEAVLANTPDHKDAYFNLAKAYRQLGRHEEAATAEAAFTRLSDFDRRVAEIRTRIGMDPNDADLRYQLGKLMMDNGRFDEAYDCFFAATTMDPTQEKYRVELEASAAKMGRGAALLDETIPRQ